VELLRRVDPRREEAIEEADRLREGHTFPGVGIFGAARPGEAVGGVRPERRERIGVVDRVVVEVVRRRAQYEVTRAFVAPEDESDARVGGAGPPRPGIESVEHGFVRSASAHRSPEVAAAVEHRGAGPPCGAHVAPPYQVSPGCGVGPCHALMSATRRWSAALPLNPSPLAIAISPSPACTV
jgi:hypothetical protein